MARARSLQDQRTASEVKAKKLRVVWLAPYRIELLQPELIVARPRKLPHASSWIVNLAHALAKRNDAELHIITGCAGIKSTQTISKGGITFHVIRYAFPFTVRGFPPYLRLDLVTRYMSLRRRVQDVIRKISPDIIHVHGTEEGYGLAALDSDAPTIVSMQGIINLCARVAPSTSYKLQADLELRVMRRAKYFGSRTAWADNFIRNVNGTATIYDFPEAINEKFFSTLRAHSNQNVLMVGSIIQRKGVQEALKAMRIVVRTFSAAKLVLVGEGDPSYLAHLKERARSLGIEANVEWFGFTNVDKLAELHADSSLLIHPSHIDNSPNSVAEAMASGLPVIASNVGGIPSMIEHNVSGLLVESKNHHELAAAMIALLHDESERQRLARRAKEVALERHHPAKVATQALRVYHAILAKESSLEYALENVDVELMRPA